MLKVIEAISDANVGGAGVLLVNRLKNTDKKVDDIAVAVGYENISYFHKLFAQRYGQSPKKFRDCK